MAAKRYRSVVVALLPSRISPGSLVFGINMALGGGLPDVLEGLHSNCLYTSTVLSAGCGLLERIFPMDGPA